MGNGGGGVWEVFLGGGEDVGREECNIAPLRRPYKPSASEPVTAASNFSNPLSPSVVPAFPTAMPLCTMNWPAIVNSVPVK